ncbi:MAG: Ig-like domain-containing protein, partial [Burkholderiales bacterium]|nr:Ig-like domain-containing protein [Burkholderiales bacterium]
MNFNELLLHILFPDGSERTIRFSNLAEPTAGFNLLNAPLLVKAEAGAQYKLLNIETGNHQKGQKLLRQNKTLKVLFENENVLELQDYFFASLTPVENAPIYRLENDSCNEVQVISHYPAEIFDVPESMLWTASDSAIDCKVALFNPSSLMGLIPTAAPAASVAAANIGLGEIAATAIGIPVFAGGNGSAPFIPLPPTDTTSPFVVITSNAASVKSNETLVITFTFSEDVGNSFIWDGTSGDIVVTGGTLSALSGTGLVRTATFTPTPNQSGISASISVYAGTYQDAAGNLGLAGLSPSITIDTLAPVITSLALTSATGAIAFASASDATISILNATDTLTATVTFDDVITVNTAGGSPTLALLIGCSTVLATYLSGTGTNALTFITTVTAGQNDSNGVAIASNALSLNGATLQDANGSNVTITSVVVADNAKYLVDTTRPTVAITSDTVTLNSSQTATFTFTFSEDPGSSFVWDGSTGDLVVSGGSLGALSTTGNPLTRTAISPATGVSGGAANVAVSLNSYTDAAGNFGQEVVAGVTDKSANITVNSIPASLSSVAITRADNIQNNMLNAGDVVYVTSTYSELVNLNVGASTPSLKLNVGGTEVDALYASGSGTPDLVFSYTILAGQTDLNGISIVANSVGSPNFNLNGRTLKDTAGIIVVNTFNAVADNVNYLVDTIAPILVSIDSSRSTFLSGQTSTITFTFSEDPGSTFTWNGTAGDVTLVEGTLTAISGTGLTRTATFYPTQGLSGANASLTINNDLFTDLAGNLGIGNTLTGLVINTIPATLMTMQLTNAVGLQNSTLNAGDTVNVTAHFSEVQTVNITGGTPKLALQIDSTAVVATYVSGAGTADLVFTYTVLAGQTDTNGIAINANALQLNGSTIKDPRGNNTELPASVVSADNLGYKVDTTAPSVSIASNVATLKAGETANITFTFSEDPGASFAWNGTTGDLDVTGGTLGAISGTGLTRTAVFTPTTNLTSGSASIIVTNLSYTDTAGNAGSAGVTPSISIDTLAPVISSVALSSSTGGIVSATDATVKNLNASDTLLATVTFNHVITVNSGGGSPTLDFVIGTSTVKAAYLSGSGTNALVFRTTLASGQNDSTGVAIAINALSLNNATIKDASGNNATITSVAVADNVKYLVDTTAPTLAITSSKATLNVGETATITFTFSEDPGSSFIWASNAGDLSVSGGTLGNLSGTGTLRTATFTPTPNVASGTANISVAQGAYTDAAGNFGGAALTPIVSIYTSTSEISSIALSSATGALNNTLNAGDVIFAKVVFNEAITLNSSGGSPTLGLLIDGTLVQAAYVSGTGNTDYEFSYTILAGQNDSTGISVPLNAISLNGSTFKNASGNNSAITNGAVADNALYAVDTTAPNVVITSSKASLKADETSVISFTFTEDPGTSFTMSDVTVTGGTLSALTGLGTVRRSTFTPTSNLTSGTASITVANLSYTDSAGNPGSAGVTPVISIDTLAPLIGSVALSSSTGGIASVSDAMVNNLNATDTLTATVTFNDAVTLNTDGGSPTLALLVSGSTLLATYVSGSGTSALLFTTTIAAGQTDPNGVAIAINALNLNNATLKDVNGNNAIITSAAVTDNAKYLVDTAAPTVGIASDVATLKAGETANITFTFSEDPGTSFAWDGSAGDVLVTGGTLGAISGTGLTRTAVFTPTADLGNGSVSMTVAANAYQDAAGNNGGAGLSPSIAIDTLAPGITSLALTSSTGGIASAGDATVNNLNATDTLTATVTFNDVLMVNTASGSPTLALVIGGSTVQATYVSGSGTNALVFTSTVAALQNDSNGVAIALNALSLNGATLKDANGNNATITSAAVVDNTKYLVDTTRPTVAVTSDTATLISAQTATMTFTFSEDPGSSFIWDGNVGDLVVTGGTLGALSTTSNPLTRTAILTPATGVSSGTANVAVNLNSYTDAAGNLGIEAVAGVTDKSVNITVNTTTTALSSVVISSADNIQNNLLNAGDVVYVTATYTELVNLNVGAGTPSLKLNIGGTEVNALYASGSGTNALVFAYTVLAAQTDINGISIVASSVGSPTFNLNGRTLTDTAGNTTVNTYSAVTDNASYLVDTTAPTLVSIASSRSTFLSGQTSTITFTFSEDPGSTFTWNGTAGDVTLVEGTLTAISGTGLTRTATFYPTQGLTGVNASLTVNNNTYTDLAGNLGTGNILTGLVINTSPATLTTMHLTSAVGLQNSTLNAGDTVNVTAHFSEAQTLDLTGGTPTLALQIDSTAVVATYVSGAGTADLVFNYTVLAGQTDTNGIAINANALQLNGSTLIDPRGNITILSASVLSADNAGYKVDTTAPTIVITSDVSQLKIGETANITFTFSEDPGSTFTWDGTTGDVNLTNGSLSAITGTGVTRSAVFTPSNNLDTRTATITVSSSTYQDSAGNNGGTGTTPSLSLDTLKPSINSVAISSATGAQSNTLNAGDTANISLIFSETVNLNLTSGSPTVSLLIGISTVRTALATYASGAGSNTLVFTTSIASGQTDTDGIAISLNALALNSAVLTDTSGNAALLTSSAVSSNASYKVDTTAPILKTILFDKSSLKASETATVTFTFSEDVSSTFTWNGTAGDLSLTGGTLSAISSFVFSGSDYVATATFTPTAGSTATGIVSTALAAYSDAAGNAGNVGSSASIAIDTVAPSLTTMNISGASGILSNTLNAGDVVEVTATFNEAVVINATGNKPQVQLNIGGTLVYAAYASGSGTTDLLFNYTILAGQNDVDGISYSANALGLNSGTLLDAAGNAAIITADLRADNLNYKVDTSAPTVTITSDKSTLLAGQTAAITFTFNEDPGASFAWNGTAGDLSLVNGTLSSVLGAGLTRTATFTPTSGLSGSNASMTVTNNSYNDYAGNLGSGGLYTFTLNTSSPSISSVAFANSVNRNNNFLGLTSTQYFTVNFSESVSLDLTFGSPTLDIVIGTTMFQAIYDSKPAGNQLKFKSIIQAGQNDSNCISLPSNGLQLNGSTIINAAGNSATLTYSGLADNISYKVDTIAPTLAFTGTSESVIKANETRTIYFVFSEIANSFDASDVSVDTGTLTWVGGSNSNYSATYRAPSNISSGTVTFSIGAGRFLDYANNPSLLDFTKTLSFDTLVPTLTISVSDRYLAAGETAIVTVTSSERLKTGFSLRNLTYPGGATTGTFSAFTENDVTGVYTATFTPSGTATLGYTIAFAAGIFQDTAGNLGLATSGGAIQSNRNTPYIDSIEFFSSTGKLSNFLNQGDTVTMRVNLPQVGFLNTASGSPTLKLMIGTEQVLATYLSGGESPNGTTQLLFKYTILSGQTDTDGISIPINALALNGSTLKSIYGPDYTITSAAVTSDSTYKVDTTPPSLSITSDRSVLNTGQTATITFTFSEDPGSTFAWDSTTGDIVLVGGTLGAISGSGLTRTATFTPTPDTASSPGSISVAAGTYTDTAGNAGGAGATPSLTIVTFKDKVYLSDIAANIGGYAIDSPNTGGYFGYAVSMVGDFNGDGFEDVISGAPLNTQIASQGGGAVIVQGGLNASLVIPGYSGMGQVTGMYLYANLANGWAGFSVAGVGDMNNDGYMDVLVGMPRNPSDATTSGQAFLVYGKKNAGGSLDGYQKEIVALAGSSAALKITLPAAGAGGGFSVSSAGDVNGDGWTDLIVSSHFEDVGSLNKAGKSYVIYGSAALSALQTVSTANVGGSVAGFTISGWQDGEESGTSVSSAG